MSLVKLINHYLHHQLLQDLKNSLLTGLHTFLITKIITGAHERRSWAPDNSYTNFCNTCLYDY